MRLTGREATLGLLTAGTALFAVTGIMAGGKIQEWKTANNEFHNTRRKIQSSRRLLGQKQRWAGEFNELREMLPRYPANKKSIDTLWLSKMQQIAVRHDVRITRQEVREEKKMGDVYELPIECREWEGSLKAIVRFLEDLEKEGAMLDMRQLLIKPKSHNVMRGRFSLFCAYTKEEEKPTR
ncbi:hypothetical protein ACFLQU_01200 [Verrucomicrobiota bacterium]